MDRITSEYVIIAKIWMKYQEFELFLPIYDQYFQCLWLLFISFIVVLSGEGLGPNCVMLFIYFTHGTKC